MPKSGRPSIFTLILAGRICARLAEGESLRAICLDPDMPVKATVMRWLARRPDFQRQYEVARLAQADALFEMMQEIADDGVGDEARSGENVQRSRLRVDTLKWRLARMAPRKYGDKVTAEVTGENGGLLKTELTIKFV
jgi:hypothetical protein